MGFRVNNPTPRQQRKTARRDRGRGGSAARIKFGAVNGKQIDDEEHDGNDKPDLDERDGEARDEFERGQCVDLAVVDLESARDRNLGYGHEVGRVGEVERAAGGQSECRDVAGYVAADCGLVGEQNA